MTRSEFLLFHRTAVEEGIAICKAKNADYASASVESADAFRNFRMVEVLFAIPAEQGVLSRMTDKCSRLNTLSLPGVQRQVADESLRQTAIDNANYSIIFAAIVHEKHTNPSRWALLNDALRADINRMPLELFNRTVSKLREELFGRKRDAVSAAPPIPPGPPIQILRDVI